MNNHAARLASLFRCPHCHHKMLQAFTDKLICPSCSRAYPLVRGVPVLLTSASQSMREQELSTNTGKLMVSEYHAIGAEAGDGSPDTATRKPWYAWLRPPPVIYHPNPRLDSVETATLFTHQGVDTLVLNVGGGPTKYRPQEITLNLEAFHNVDVVGDAHNLPLNDASVDSIICNAVLEHVRDPHHVVAELIRVLKPGGMLYAEVPFIFFFHGYPNDFTRFTREGMKRLFRDLDEPTIGISGGPMSALLQTANIVLPMLVPSSNRFFRKLVNGAFRWVVFPLKYLDIWLNKKSEAHLTASGFYVIGRRAPVPIRLESGVR